MSHFNLTDKVAAYLKENPYRQPVAREIAEWIYARFPLDCRLKQLKSKSDRVKTAKGLIQQISAEISARFTSPISIHR